MTLIVAMLVLLPLPALVHVAARGLRRLRRHATWPDSAPHLSDDPFRGYKIAQVVLGERGAYLMGVLDVRYDVDDEAVCLRVRCTPPGLDCVCGFYAFKDRTAAVRLLHELHRNRPHTMYVLLSVDLDGDVLEYEHGYRAQRQRIVRMELPDQCSRCEGALGGSPAVYVTHPKFRVEHLGTTRDVQTHSALPHGAAPVRVLCEHHVLQHGAKLLTVSAIRERIDTEVTLLPRDEQPPPNPASDEAA